MALKIDILTKLYGDKIAVDNLSLTVEPGMLYAFLGPNGAGKTTTIKVATGLLRPTSGRVTVFGHDIHADSVAARRLISYIPDEPYLYEKLSGREFLQFVGQMYGMEPRDCDWRIEELSERFGTTEYIDGLAESYSHGMKQRVVITAAILHDPKVLIVDEPMVGLDPRSARLVKDVLREMAESGVCVFMSTHTLPIAEDVASRIGIINRGVLVAEGTVDELRPQGHTSTKLEDIFLTLTEETATAPGGAAGRPEGESTNG
jgi:ABC-2 type transport system ATP-binding protein